MYDNFFLAINLYLRYTFLNYYKNGETTSIYLPPEIISKTQFLHASRNEWQRRLNRMSCRHVFFFILIAKSEVKQRGLLYMTFILVILNLDSQIRGTICYLDNICRHICTLFSSSNNNKMIELI